MNLGRGWRPVDLQRFGATPRYALILPDRTLDILAQESRDRIDVLIEGVSYSVGTARPRKGRGKQDEDDEAHFENGRWILVAPITGSVVEIRVAVDQKVETGTILMIVEAMKMQNELRSRVPGVVTGIKVEKGQRVDTGTALVEVSALPELPP